MARRSSGRSTAELSYAISRFESLGMTRNQALGTLGSLAGESGRGLNTQAFNPKDPNGGSYGIGQWQGSRRTALEKFAKQVGKPVSDFKTQVDFIAHELTNTPEKKTLAQMKANPNMTLAQAAKTWTNGYERPNPKYAHHNVRAQNAQYFADMMAGKKVAPATNASLTGATNVGGPLDAIDRMTGSVADQHKALAKAAGVPTPASAYDGSRANMGSNPYATGQAGVPTPQDGIVARATNAGEDIMGGITKVGEFFGGLATGGLATGVQTGQDVDGFWGKPNTSAIVGTLAGGFFGGMPGALIGGVVGQAIGRSLGNVGSLFGGNQLNPGMSRDMFPETPGGQRSDRGDGSLDRASMDRLEKASPKAAKEAKANGGKATGLY